MPRASVIIPAYNAGRFLGEAIESALGQTLEGVEVIVVNDGSSDDTQSVIEAFGDRIIGIAQPNAGASAARNAGLARASGTYVAFLDADDVLLPEKMALQVGVLEGDPGLALVASGLDVVDPGGRCLRVVRPWAHHPQFDEYRMAYIGLIGIHGVLLRRSWLDRVGGFDPTVRFVEDVDLWWRIWRAGGRMAWLPTVVGQYRIHAGNLSQRSLEHHRWWVELVRRRLASGALTPEVAAQAPEVLALHSVAVAGRLYGQDSVPLAQQCLVEAIRIDPALLTSRRVCFLDAIARWRDDPWIADRDRVLAKSLACLPESLGWLAAQRSRLEQRYWRSVFYGAAAERQGRSLRRAWFRCAMRDPGWLANRGSWSLLARSFFYTGCERSARAPGRRSSRTARLA